MVDVGYSVLGLSPSPHFKPNMETPLYIGKEVGLASILQALLLAIIHYVWQQKFDAYMRRLHKQIVDFCSFQGIPFYQHEE